MKTKEEIKQEVAVKYNATNWQTLIVRLMKNGTYGDIEIMYKEVDSIFNFQFTPPKMKDIKSPKQILQELVDIESAQHLPKHEYLAKMKLLAEEAKETLSNGFTPSKDAEEAKYVIKALINQEVTGCSAGFEYNALAPLSNFYSGMNMGQLHELLNKAFMAGRSSQPIERVDANALHDIFYQKYQNYLLHEPEGCMKRAFIETVASFSSSHTGKMREALQMVKDYFFEVGHEEGHADEVYENVVAALSTKPTDEPTK